MAKFTNLVFEMIMVKEILHPTFILLAVFFIVQLVIWLSLYLKMANYKPDCEIKRSKEPVSILISAKNEARNLEKNLSAILEQDYADFEVIVINDQSADGTGEVLEKFSKKYKNLKVVTIEEYIKKFEGKKFAISLGIKKAANNLLLFTDADCAPVSKNWISYMVHSFKEGKKIVLGFSPYERKGSLLNAFIQYDTFHTALNYFSFALAGIPYMGVGRNLAYQKSFFMDHKGFASHLHIPMGDDDLFVNKLSNKANCGLSLCDESFMMSTPKEKWSQWWKQKKRHLKAGRFYNRRSRSMLSGVWLANFLFYISAIMAICFFPCSYIIWSVVALKFLIQTVISGMVLKKLKMMFVLPTLIFLDLFFQIFYLPIMNLSVSSKNKKEHW